MGTSGTWIVYPGHVIYDRNINNQNDSNRNHLPGSDYLYEHPSDFAAEHKNKVYFSDDSVKGRKSSVAVRVAARIANIVFLGYYIVR